MKALPSKRYIIWSCDPARLDPSDPWVRRWWIQQVLVHGRMEDIRELDLTEVRAAIPHLVLPPEVRSLWNTYFGIATG